MSLIQWNDTLSLHVEELDRQHMKLIAIINELHDAMGQGRGKRVVGDILDRLVDYTTYHFGAEEQLMEAHAYPGSARHHVQHVEFVKRLIELRAAYAQRQIALSITVMTFLSDWLVDHIMGSDQLIGPHLAAKVAP